MAQNQEIFVALLISCVILLYLLKLLIGEKTFGNTIAKITRVTLEILWGLVKGIFQAFFTQPKKKSGSEEKEKDKETHIHIHLK